MPFDSLNPILEVADLSKTYPLGVGKFSSFWKALTGGKNKGFNALRSISFEAYRGDTVGIIGLNGAGKSTLLQIISGTLAQTYGEVKLRGKLSAVLELGSGFDYDFSGKENARIYASVLGIAANKISRVVEEIISFSELGDFADLPLKTYSSGMIARLAFSSAVCVESEILLLDEVFSVGDQAFARKSFERIKQLINSGRTVLISSHSPYHIQMICNKVLYLKNGEVDFYGPTKEALVKFEQDIESKCDEDSEPNDESTSGKGKKVRFQEIVLKKNDLSIDSLSKEEKVFKSNRDDLSINMKFQFDKQSKPPKIGVVIHDSHRRPLACAGSHFDGFDYKMTSSSKTYSEVEVKFPSLKLLKGEFEIDVFLLCEEGFLLLDHLTLSQKIKVEQDGKEVGIFNMDHLWEDLSG